jgi:dimethylamine monooxygenase subunit A
MKQPIYLPSATLSARLSMGLKPLSLLDWIEIDDHFEHYLMLKTHLLKHNYSEVFASLAGTQAAQQEVLDLLLDHLLVKFPQIYRRARSQFQNLLTGENWDLQAFEQNPLDLAGRLIQEDLCLMQSRAGNYILSAASLCFPFHWTLRDKLGKPLSQIHDPVPGYQEDLACPVDHFFDRLRADHPVYRFNWGIADKPDLALNYARNDKLPAITVDNIGKTLWLRMERQTLRRLEKSQSVLFSIRTYVYPLSILQAYPSAAQNLATRVQQATPELLGYKSILPIQDVLLRYLEEIQSSQIPSH